MSIRKYEYFLTAVLLLLPASPFAHAQNAARYEAVFFDGARLDGDRVLGWHEHPGSPRLDKTALFDAKRPLRWLRDRRLKPWVAGKRGPGYIEFVGGDRLVGRIEGLCPAGGSDGLYVPAHLLVKPAHLPVKPGAKSRRPVNALPEHVRVLPDRIQRVVFDPASHRRLRPGSLYYLDGRQIGFDHLRWKTESVALLHKDGIREVKFSEIAEVHLPQIDPWRAYYRELAVLSPDCRSRLMRIETIWGLIATGSDMRFLATHYATHAHKQQAMKRLWQLGERIARTQNALREYRRELDDARAAFETVSAGLIEEFNAAKKASERAKAEMQRRINQDGEKDAARLARERQKIDREFQSAEEAIIKKTAGQEPQDRDRLLKEFRRKQSELRKARIKALEDSQAKSEQERQKALQRFPRQETQKLKQLEADQQEWTRGPKAWLDRATAQWNQQMQTIEHLKSQRVHAIGNCDNSDTWRHMIQPVWSLDALWIPFGAIHTRWSFAPQQVPLCRVRPSATVSPPLLPVCMNRNSIGQPLRSGGRQYAWGFAVHAYSELRFPLANCAVAFRSSIGLDRTVGSGGCARARVYVGSAGGEPAYESPLLVGSKKTVDTGRVELALAPSGPRQLVLQADPADRDSPPGADRLNVRDKLDWLDPRIELDMPRLQDQVHRQIGSAIAGSQGWSLAPDRRGDYMWTNNFYETGESGQGRFLTMLRMRGKPLGLSREITIGPADKWLAVYVGLPTGENPHPDTIALRIGDKQVPPLKIPVRQLWQKLNAPFVFGLGDYQGRKITLNLTQPSGGRPLHWQAVSISSVPPEAYRMVDIMKLAGKGDGHISYGLGRVLQSSRVSKDQKLAAVEISKLGGVVNYRTEATSDGVVNVMLDKDWTGGDKALIENSATFKRLPALRTLSVTEYSGVSRGAIAKFQVEMPKVAIRRFLWEIGKADRDYSDLALAGKVMEYARHFPTDPVFAIGKDDERKSWPCIHPGPYDGWGGGNREYTFTVTFDMGPSRQKFYKLKINLVSAHGGAPPEVKVSVNETSWNIQLDKGPEQDVPAMSNPAAGRPRTYVVTVLASILKAAGNRLTITTMQGSWFLYDSLQFVGSDNAP